eukprot:CAMPEP_0170099116 /NCGR_PEP_ID=MMETSP0020_2-20130122/835_1 /TAXON_ID=98059 /ORGANISM="Dinobryon sp., Strain UTEXLB2267" /LENGTH=367 /DNA_ID=CAMNT_0010321687 /DNA_START=54 /DNA_END=1157 /DNA_ORIENTATION=-
MKSHPPTLSYFSSETNVNHTMLGAILPGDSTVKLQKFPIPKPSYGEVIVQTKCSTICGSDIRCIYRKYEGSDQEAYKPGTICGHEPAGVVLECGPGTRRFKVGDRVIVYHISGCGVCHDCRKGFMISCQSNEHRKSYGFQRDGGMAPYVLADEKDLILLPQELSFADGAQIACGFGTVYEGLERIGISGNDAVLVMGLGPVGLAALQLSRALGARKLIGIDTQQHRLDLAMKLGLADHVFLAHKDNVQQVMDVTEGKGCEKAVDCSGNHVARLTCIHAARQWGKICFIGEGDSVSFDVSSSIIHPQKTIYGSWVTSIWKMEELVERIVQWGIHPEAIITDKFPLEQASDAYARMAEGQCGKVAITFE